MSVKTLGLSEFMAHEMGIPVSEAKALIEKKQAEINAKKTREKELSTSESLVGIVENLTFINDSIQNDRVSEMWNTLDKELDTQIAWLQELSKEIKGGK